MFKRMAMVALGLALCGCSAEPGAPAETACVSDGVEAMNAWTRPARAGQPTSAAYLSLCNGAASDDALIRVRFDGAEASEIHQTQMSQSGMASMTHTAKIALPAGETTQLAPGGAHIMLIDLGDALTVGDQVSMTLEFEKAPPAQVIFQVREASPDGHNDHSGHTSH